MSEQYLRLVANLTPPGRRYEVASPTAYRTRFVLFVLAYLADDDGRCVASLNDLSALTTLQPPVVRASLRELQNEHGFIEIVRTTKAPNVYRLDRSQLRARQYVSMLRTTGGTPSVDLLREYGLDSRSVNALRRVGINTTEQLGERIAAFHHVKAASYDDRFAFHHFLDISNLGERSANKILASYEKWSTEDATEPDLDFRYPIEGSPSHGGHLTAGT